MNQTTSPTHFSLPLRLVLGIILILTLSLWAFYWLMNPPMTDFGLMAVFLAITALISTLASYGAYRIGWIHRSPTIRWTLIGSYGLSSLLIFINVWMTARLMFASQHDLLLATVLLLFASGIAMVMGFFFSSALTDRIRQLDVAARSIAGGDLDTRIPIEGQDEIADLSRSFNEMAAQLQTANIKQQEAENLRRELIAWVSHDLQTPLASIRAIIEALADGVVDEQDTIQRYLNTAQRDIGSLSSLIDDLFQLAQLDAGGLQLDLAENSLSDLISDALESYAELAKQGEITLRGSVQPGFDPVWMDALRIGRVLNNLIGNAIQYTPAGGVVKVIAASTNEGVLVQVIDSGEGISPADQTRVFERFFRGEKSRSRLTGGAGLGLAIARGIVEAHGGEISVDSIPGEFTNFSFFLPPHTPN